jgi:multidrug transporter EmrE-like cation transporter
LRARVPHEVITWAIHYHIITIHRYPRQAIPLNPEIGIMNTPLSSILLFLLASILGAIGQFLYKGGADAAQGGLLSYLLNVRILLGVACYCAVMVLFVAAFKRGGSLAVLYPIYASTFIWAALISALAFATPVKLINIAGMGLLVGGMYCMGR